MINEFGAWAPHLPMSWLVALAHSQLHTWLYGMRFLHGVLRFVHILSMGAFFGVLVFVEVTRIQLVPRASIQPVRGPLFAVMNRGFEVAITSGLLLFLYDPIGVGSHAMFLPKLMLVALGLIHAFWLQRRAMFRKSEQWRRIGAAIALAIWILVLGCSTWNHEELIFKLGQYGNPTEPVKGPIL